MNRAEHTVVQIVAIDETGDTMHRMRWPAEQLAQQAANWAIVNVDAQHPARFHLARHADLLVIYQTHDVSLLPLIHERRKQGLKTLCEYNDNFYDPPAASPVANAWGSPLLWSIYENFMHHCDGVIVTGPGLENLFRNITNTPLVILENHLPGPPRAPREKGAGERISIGWAGSLGHVADLLGIIPVLHSILDELPGVDLAFMGNEALPSLLPLPAQRCRFHPWGGMHEYFDFLATLDIGIAPLIDTSYNRCRSDVKALEYTSAGALPVLTSLTPYREFLRATGLRGFATFGELRSQLVTFCKDPETRHAALQRCHSYVASERVGLLRRERLELYTRMLSPRPATGVLSYAPGFHELPCRDGTAQTETAVFTAEETSLDSEALLGLLQERCGSAVGTADSVLRGVHQVAARSPGAALALLPECEKQFPSDPRFLLLAIRLQSTPDLWRRLLTVLRRYNRNGQRFFQEMIERSLEKILAQGAPVETATLEELNGLYPDSAPVALHLAHRCISEGHAAKAQRLFADLRKTVELQQANRQALQGLEISYLATWETALKCWVEKRLVAHPAARGKGGSARTR